MIGHLPDQLFEEVAYIAYHFHWDRDSILDMTHLERRRWVDEIAAINRRLSETAGEEGEPWS
jgi:hypothetical protein